MRSGQIQVRSKNRALRVAFFFFARVKSTGHGRMEGDTGGLIMMAEAGAEVEAGATESGASEPPQAEMAAG